SFSPFALSINDLRAARAESLEASGILPYAELPVPQGLQLEPEGSQLRLHGTANSAGGQITISVLIRPVIDQGRLLLKVDQVDAPNPFLKPIISSMVEKSFQGISQPPLPLGLALSGAQVGPVGLTLSANSNQVSLGGS
ncbi:MAG: hypothetical protein ACREP9_07465, partial [Candidatus Dormibacteraceae bacterium]